MKKISLWEAITIHVIVAGLIIPLGTSHVVEYVLSFISSSFLLKPIITIVTMIVFWFGVKYWAKYFNAQFEFGDRKNIALLSSSLLIILYAGYYLSGFSEVTVALVLAFVVVNGIIILPFYISTKKYIEKI